MEDEEPNEEMKEIKIAEHEALYQKAHENVIQYRIHFDKIGDIYLPSKAKIEELEQSSNWKIACIRYREVLTELLNYTKLGILEKDKTALLIFDAAYKSLLQKHTDSVQYYESQIQRNALTIQELKEQNTETFDSLKKKMINLIDFMEKKYPELSLELEQKAKNDVVAAPTPDFN